jgi:L-alanine-DL-glutamate epimerase-like enolase superfamily enzyme
MEYVNSLEDGSNAAKAAIDIALHDLAGKMAGLPLWKVWNIDISKAPLSSFTVGIDSPSVIKAKLEDASEFKLIKVKLGGGNDREMINSVKEVTDKQLIADVNQGWRDKYFALDTIHWLKDQGVLFVEQPLPDNMEKELEWLTERSPLPIYADEGIKTIEDLERRKGAYSGVNIKLMKCGGLINARKMIDIARSAGMQVMTGCMTETSCAVTAASQLSPLADLADLDGNMLIVNDCYEGMKVFDGRVIIPGRAGIGITEI